MFSSTVFLHFTPPNAVVANSIQIVYNSDTYSFQFLEVHFSHLTVAVDCLPQQHLLFTYYMQKYTSNFNHMHNSDLNLFVHLRHDITIRTNKHRANQKRLLISHFFAHQFTNDSFSKQPTEDAVCWFIATLCTLCCTLRRAAFVHFVEIPCYGIYDCSFPYSLDTNLFGDLIFGGDGFFFRLLSLPFSSARMAV